MCFVYSEREKREVFQGGKPTFYSVESRVHVVCAISVVLLLYSGKVSTYVVKFS